MKLADEQARTLIPYIIEATGLKPFQVEHTVDLLQEGATVPFIARYRKEQTGELDEVQIRTVVSVSEAGASIYSASEIAREEFPDLDLTVRGAISIARRLQDPLGELAKAITRYRDENGSFSSRKALLKVPRFGAKAFEQAAGFLRIRGAHIHWTTRLLIPSATSWWRPWPLIWVPLWRNWPPARSWLTEST